VISSPAYVPLFLVEDMREPLQLPQLNDPIGYFIKGKKYSCVLSDEEKYD